MLEEEEVIVEEVEDESDEFEDERSPAEVESIVPNFFAEWLA